MPEQDKTASEVTEKLAGNAEVATPSNGKEDNVETKPELNNQNPVKPETDLEELTYKERYANSTKEAQKLVEENKRYREKFGSLEDVSEEAKSNDNPDEKKDEPEKKPAEAETKPEEKPEQEAAKPVITQPVDAATPPELSKNNGEQAAFEVVWDLFVEKNQGMNDPKVANDVAREIKRFAVDVDGNRVPYKKALSDAYRFVYGDTLVKQSQENARAQGIIDATKNKAGTMGENSGRQSNASTPSLTSEEQATAKNLGMTEEEYLKNREAQ